LYLSYDTQRPFRRLQSNCKRNELPSVQRQRKNKGKTAYEKGKSKPLPEIKQSITGSRCVILVENIKHQLEQFAVLRESQVTRIFLPWLKLANDSICPVKMIFRLPGTYFAPRPPFISTSPRRRRAGTLNVPSISLTASLRRAGGEFMTGPVPYALFPPPALAGSGEPS
jgi:hypothetical protein